MEINKINLNGAEYDIVDTLYESKSAISGGTDLSLVTTGEKYSWGQKLDAIVFNTTYNASSNKAATMSDIPSTLPASDVSSWAKQSSKPSYAYSEITYTATPITASSTTVSLDGTTPIYIVSFSAAITGVTLSANPAAGHSCHVLFANTSASDLTVDITHDATNRVCPEGSSGLQLTVKAGGYGEVDFLNANSKVYVRGV